MSSTSRLPIGRSESTPEGIFYEHGARRPLAKPLHKDPSMRLFTSLACALSCAALLHAQQASMDAATCERLATSLHLQNARVTLAQPVTSGRFVPSAAPGASAPPAAVEGLPSFCRVVLTLTPSSDSDIKSEVWLPLAGWTGKFQQVGNGGWGGSIQYAALATALRRGYAASSTDT